ncbi:MAG: 5-oxoprolinase [endosymbiont of Galathealinum brachiosum]|uniref:5-oxoprolinase n=1 Tax=endosymbiont of Galathealinum brachiosum TaxID=2200906 RepID=A0A370D9T2_9GAMM|nr:MAG: 5-oxoprolinase [endosymbiont of Galathealinum brachiosum]
MDVIALSVFSSRIEAVCDEMGAVLQRVAFSPNIKDRLDYSCAVFDAQGELCAQAAHIPVHLGSMAYAARDIVRAINWEPGDMVVLNDPYLGGTHLPDITLIAPVFFEESLLGFVANRAHHADIGADSPGSMPVSSELSQEGLIIPPTHLLKNDRVDADVMDELLSVLKNPQQSHGDFSAQISANRRGLLRLQELISGLGIKLYEQALIALNDYAASIARDATKEITPGVYNFTDVMDDDGQGNIDIKIKATITVNESSIMVDFAGTANQVKGNINCPLSVAAAAVYYVFRCLMPDYTPACAGSFRHISLSAPEGCLLNASRPAAVAAGNVETSTRIVDVIIGALVKTIPEKLPAASHGSMNNLAMGAVATSNNKAWDYYETIGGGMGANALFNGLSGVQTHMTNTLNTPIEVLEMNYPLRVNEYALRKGAAGEGEFSGGEGLIRSFTLLQDTHVTLLTERRKNAPWGINASDGAVGENLINGERCSAKFSRLLKAGDRLTIKTPGGGGYTKD